MLSPTQMLDKVAVGNDAAYALTFHRETSGTVESTPVLTVSREDYYAEIEATLPSDLAGGRYRFVVEGMTDEHYAKIAQTGDGYPRVVRLHLYWRDTNASVGGYLANLAGLTDLLGGASGDALADARVAELAITKVSRRVGSRRYETVIEAQERVYKRLAEKRLATTLEEEHFLAAVQHLANEAGVSVTSYGFGHDGSLPAPSGSAPGDESISFRAGITYAAAVKQVAHAMEHLLQRYGRGLLLISDGTLVLGERPIPPDDRATRELSFTNGLVHSEKVEPERHPNAGSDDPEADDDAAPEREQWQLTLKGRPDIRPGDLVGFHPAAEETQTTPTSVLGAVAGSFLGPLVAADESSEPKVTLYVGSVEHKLGRTSGFVTKVTGVKVAAEDGSDAWDAAPPPGSSAEPGGSGARGRSSSHAVDAAQTMRDAAERAAAANRNAEVGEIRASHASGSSEPPSQTERIWRGLVAPDGHANQARRLAIRRHEPSPIDGVAYASPFAWGKCGLVLPRYPGTRVVFVHRNGVDADPVEVGALWESGQGPDSDAGDWWLILPSGVSQSDRGSIADSESAPAAYTGNATNDLIDADGNRVIEVGELTLRIGRNSLASAGTRPQRGSEQDGITIEHADAGAKVTIASDGKITIHAAADLELVADGDIKLQATNVDVQVSGQMNVH
jgi:hypothetical protein